IADKKAIENAANSVIASVKDDNPGAEAPLEAALTKFVNLFEGTDKIESVKKTLDDLRAKALASKTTAALGTVVDNVIVEIAKLFKFSAPASILDLPDDTLTIGTDVFNTPLPGKTLTAL